MSLILPPSQCFGHPCIQAYQFPDSKSRDIDFSSRGTISYLLLRLPQRRHNFKIKTTTTMIIMMMISLDQRNVDERLRHLRRGKRRNFQCRKEDTVQVGVLYKFIIKI